MRCIVCNFVVTQELLVAVTKIYLRSIYICSHLRQQFVCTKWAIVTNNHNKKRKILLPHKIREIVGLLIARETAHKGE